ncbi:MAG: hypothetical protein WC054_00990 [Candidatus Nanopelagicales bacterium]
MTRWGDERVARTCDLLVAAAVLWQVSVDEAADALDWAVTRSKKLDAVVSRKGNYLEAATPGPSPVQSVAMTTFRGMSGKYSYPSMQQRIDIRLNVEVRMRQAYRYTSRVEL